MNVDGSLNLDKIWNKSTFDESGLKGLVSLFIYFPFRLKTSLFGIVKGSLFKRFSRWKNRIRFWQNWEFFSSVSWQTFELIKTRSCGVQTPTYPTDFHHRWWRLRHTKVRASTKAAGWGFHSEVRVLCEVLGCGFLHLRNLHEELILGSNIVVGSRCSCVAGGVRII